MANTLLSISIIPYLLFLYLVYRIWRVNPAIIGKTTLLGFSSMLGFVFITAIAGSIAVRVMGASTLGHVDWLHGIAEFGLTVTNGLIALGLKKQLDEIKLAELDED